MQDVMAEFGRQLSATVELLTYAYLLLVFTWPVFLLLERLTPVVTGQPRSNLWFNWKIVLANFLLSVPFYAFAVTVSSFAAGAIGGPFLPFPLFDVVRDVPFVGVVLHAGALFLAACFLGDFWYYWWHRAQHELPLLWELHKLHHSRRVGQLPWHRGIPDGAPVALRFSWPPRDDRTGTAGRNLRHGATVVKASPGHTSHDDRSFLM